MVIDTIKLYIITVYKLKQHCTKYKLHIEFFYASLLLCFPIIQMINCNFLFMSLN